MGFGVSIPTRMHLGCIRRRHFALVVTVRNRSRNPVKFVPARADQSWAEIGMISRVAVQFRLAPSPPTADLLVVGMLRWSPVKGDAGRARSCRVLAEGRQSLMPGCLSGRAVVAHAW